VNVVALATHHARTVILATILLIAAGAVAAWQLPSSIYPPLEFPRIVVIARSGTLPTRAMTLNVTRPLEQAAMATPGIRRVRSKTFRGATEVDAHFDSASDMTVALQQLQSRVEEVRQELPDATELTVERLTPATFPVLSVNVTGSLPIPDLYDYAFYVMRPALARAPGVGRLEVSASDTREVEVIVDPARLTASGLTISEVATAIGATNVLAPIGRYAASGRQYLALASGQWHSLSDVAATPIPLKGGSLVRVADLGEVVMGAPDRTLLITANGQDAAIISLSQQVGSNVLDVKAGVEQALRDLSKTLPSGLRVTKVYDLAEFVAAAIASVRDAVLLGGVLAIVILFVFLRDWRITAVASVTLPITAIATFFFMRLSGESINLMSMGGLAIAIGLVIDDAVVVVENIDRQLDAGLADADVTQSTNELVAPIVGSTLTTVVVFAPLALLSGVTGQFFRSLALTLSVAVLLSLVLSLTLVPVLATSAVRRRVRRGVAREPHHVSAWYARSLGALLMRPALALLLVALAALAALGVYPLLGHGFLPEMDEGGFVIDYLSPSGTALVETDRRVRAVEKVLARTPEVAAFQRRTGSELGLFATEITKGDILVRLVPRSKRERDADEVIDSLRDELHDAAPGLEIEFVQLLQDMLGDLEGNPTPIEVKIFGDDPKVLDSFAGKAEAALESVSGVVDIVGPQPGNPEVEWQVDPVATARVGLTVSDIANQISAGWLGLSAPDFRMLDRSVPVRIRYPDALRRDTTALGDTRVRGSAGQLIPLSALATPITSNGQSTAMRENLRTMVLVTARLEGRDLGSAVTELRARLAKVPLPVGYAIEIGGQVQSQRQAFNELLLVLGVASALVLVVLVAEFRAILPALLILCVAPLSAGGAFLLLLATGTELNVSSAMGLILLVGLVVKNGIVLMDFAARQHAAGASWHDSLVAAGARRLRPILMTTLCTLAGLLPLALGLGAGAELQRPLALAVIGGLSLSTLLVLYVLPALFLLGRRREHDIAAGKRFE
jgi:CzcA family heavy metal efflux pump